MKISINDTQFVDNAKDVKHKDIVTVVSEGKWEVSEKFKKEDGSPQNVFKVNLKVQSGEERNATLNWTNVKILVSELGDETSTWIGTQLRAWKTKSEKAKIGYTFLYVPTDWERDDTGEWIGAKSETSNLSQADKDAIKAIKDYENMSHDEIIPSDIPF